ncbi:MAG: lysophospholipid acyltransferase family protein [Lacipirellulaceae bacterium]
MTPTRGTAVDYAGYMALRLVVAVVQALPLSLCDRLATWLGWMASDVFRVRGDLVEENLRIAFPDWSAAERRQVTRRTWRHLLLMVAEIAHTPRKVHRTSWRRHCKLDRDALVVSTLLDAGPKVLISGHFGNFELGGYLVGLFGFPTHTVARTIDNPYVDRYVNEFRSRTGQYMLPKTGSADDVERVMSHGGAITLLGDQAAGPKGCWVDFFGKPASTHKAVSLFTLSYAAPTLVIAVRRQEAPLRYRVGPEDSIDPREPGFALGTTPLFTQWFTAALERSIRRNPDQYWWVHRRWKGEPPKRRPKPTEGATSSSAERQPGEGTAA